MVKMAKIWKHSSLTFLNHFFLLKYFLDQTLHWCFKLHWVKLWFVFSLNLFLGVSLSGIYDESIISWSYSESYFGFGRNFVKTWIEFSHLTLFLILREICLWNEWKKDFWILFLSHTGAHHRLFIIWPMWYLSASMKDYPGTYCHVEVTYYILHYLNL